MRPHLMLAGSLLLSAALVGCSSTPKPDTQMAMSRQAIESATAAGGAEHAPVELKTAHDKIKQADTAIENENYLEARRLAEEATVDARLAESIAEAAEAQAALANARKGNAALRQEIDH